MILFTEMISLPTSIKWQLRTPNLLYLKSVPSLKRIKNTFIKYPNSLMESPFSLNPLQLQAELMLECSWMLEQEMKPMKPQDLSFL
jgi:hypothetical protein